MNMACEAGPSSQRSAGSLVSLDPQFWSDLYTLEITSDECLSKVRSLLNCPSKIAVARSFQGNGAGTFVNFLDQVSEVRTSCPNNLKPQIQVLVHSYLDDKLRQRCLRLLSKICKAQRIVPASYILQSEFISVGSVQDRGGFSEVSDGEYMGCTVAIKDLKTNEGDFDRFFKVCLMNLARSRYSTSEQRFCREIVGWKHLYHPNILPLLGVTVSTNPPRFRILSEWMPNGNLMLYTRSKPEANRLQLVSRIPFPQRLALS